MVDFTVAIPTYNGETRLPDVLERLRSQIGTEHFSWEVMVVDNNSLDNTAKVVRDYQANWPQAFPLRYCFAPEQGAAFARQRAVEKAKGQFIGFLDDDNLPEPNWVSAAYAFSQEHPEIGAYGSQIHGYFFEKNPQEKLPDNLKRIACFLAIIERGKTPHKYDPKHKILPPGAGLVVRKQAWENHVPKRLFLNHKGKDAGLASEDLEALLHIQRGGWDIWYNPAMVVHHKIPNARLEKEYLQLLIRCVGLSRHRLRMLTLKSWQRPFAFPAYLANDLRRLVLHIIKHGSAIKTDTAAACEMEYLTSTLKSPLFLWKTQFLNSKETRGDRISAEQSEAGLKQIAEAFEDKRFCLHSQLVRPIASDRSEPEHREILLRLEDSTGKLILPGQFMPVAECHNLMRTIDRWVIRNLCAQITKAGQAQSDIIYEINLSAASINDARFIDFLKWELELQQVSPQRLGFAINETIAIADLDGVAQNIRCLKNMGCHITIDQVGRRIGAGNYLQKLPIDYLKIDGHLVKGIVQNSQNIARLNEIHQFGQKLGIQTVAEYVENQAILEKTKAVGVNYAQGYAIAPPQPLAFHCQLPDLEDSQLQFLEKSKSKAEAIMLTV